MSSRILLKWSSHKDAFFNALTLFREEDSFCDATLVCDGNFYPVHKLILSVYSDYFKEIFEKIQCKHPFIVLKDVNHSDLESLLSYIYIGEVFVSQSKISSLISAAECLQIKSISTGQKLDEDSSDTLTDRQPQSGELNPKRRKLGNGQSLPHAKKVPTKSSVPSDRRVKPHVNHTRDNILQSLLYINTSNKKGPLTNVPKRKVPQKSTNWKKFSKKKNSSRKKISKSSASITKNNKSLQQNIESHGLKPSSLSYRHDISEVPNKTNPDSVSPLYSGPNALEEIEEISHNEDNVMKIEPEDDWGGVTPLQIENSFHVESLDTSTLVHPEESSVISRIENYTENATSNQSRCSSIDEGLYGKDLYRCGNRGCDMNFDTKLELKEHLPICNYFRSKEALFCFHCNKTYKDSYSFIHHVSTHGRKRFYCGLEGCTYKGVVLSYVTKHIRTVHNCDWSEPLPKDITNPNPETQEFYVYPKK